MVAVSPGDVAYAVVMEAYFFATGCYGVFRCFPVFAGQQDEEVAVAVALLDGGGYGQTAVSLYACSQAENKAVGEDPRLAGA